LEGCIIRIEFSPTGTTDIGMGGLVTRKTIAGNANRPGRLMDFKREA